MAAPYRAMLLVGEGDFSFTLSVVRKHSFDKVVSSCFQREDQVLKRDRIVQTIHVLTERGVDILFGIDATCLHENRRIVSQRFDVIIFNFPHHDGKANLKKNRRLLYEFFASASQCLAPGGEIRVALCEGQGGTPLDGSAQRAWADSWQVVAMAAKASFIMADACPFLKEDFPEYSCTGFRGQVSKPFNINGAFIHIFKRSAPIDLNDLTMSSEYHLQKTFSKQFCFRSVIAYVQSLLRVALNLSADVTWPETVTTNPVPLTSEGPVTVQLSIDRFSEESIHPKSYPLRRLLLITPTSSHSLQPATDVIERNLHVEEYSCSDSQLTVQLDLVAMRLHHVPTTSLLYCYSSLLPDGDTFRPLCMHPPSWNHDLSFWHDDAFDEQQFLLLVRQVTNPYVGGVLLIDDYQEEGTGRKARCYSMSYQSYIDALSWDRSREIQEQLRLALTEKWHSCVIR